MYKRQQENADVVFNSSLVYEMAVLKKYAYGLLRQIDADAHMFEARRILRLLNYVEEMEEETIEKIPPTSILREFIGGSSYDL